MRWMRRESRRFLQSIIPADERTTMSSQAVASQAFLEALLANVEQEASRRDVEFLVEELFPVLIPGLAHLLKARSENQRRAREEERDEAAAASIQPLDHLARYLMRHNPRHGEPTAESTELKAIARKLLRK